MARNVLNGFGASFLAVSLFLSMFLSPEDVQKLLHSPNSLLEENIKESQNEQGFLVSNPIILSQTEVKMQPTSDLSPIPAKLDSSLFKTLASYPKTIFMTLLAMALTAAYLALSPFASAPKDSKSEDSKPKQLNQDSYPRGLSKSSNSPRPQRRLRQSLAATVRSQEFKDLQRRTLSLSKTPVIIQKESMPAFPVSHSKPQRRDSLKQDIFGASETGNLDALQSLIEAETDINQANDNGETPLILASKNNHLDVVQFLIELKADLDQKDTKNDAGALHIAAWKGYLDIVKALVEAGADISLTDSEGMEAFDLAENAGHDEIVSYLQEKRDELEKEIEEQEQDERDSEYRVKPVQAVLDDEKRQTFTEALCTACGDAACLEVAKQLIIQGADINGHNQNQNTPLYNAANNYIGEIAKMLILSGADVNQAAPLTPLFVAVRNNHFDLVKLLLEKKANVNQVNPDGSTPIQAAVCYNHVDLVKELLQAGADVNQADSHGFTALSLAQTNNNPEIVALLEAN